MEHTWQLAARLVARLVRLPEQLRRQRPTPLPAAALLATSRAPLAVACPHACACCVLGGRCGGRSLQVQWQEASSQLGPMAGISHLTGAKAQVVQGMRQLSAAGPASQPCFPCLPLPSPWSSSPSPTDTKGKLSPCLRASYLPSPTPQPTDPVPRGLLTLWAGLHICIYIYICIYIHTYICIYIYIYVPACLRAWLSPRLRVRERERERGEAKGRAWKGRQRTGQELWAGQMAARGGAWRLERQGVLCQGGPRSCVAHVRGSIRVWVED